MPASDVTSLVSQHKLPVEHQGRRGCQADGFRQDVNDANHHEPTGTPVHAVDLKNQTAQCYSFELLAFQAVGSAAGVSSLLQLENAVPGHVDKMLSFQCPMCTLVCESQSATSIEFSEASGCLAASDMEPPL